MTEKKLTENLKEPNVEVDEENESMTALKDMIKTLDELPTDVLEQLAQNLDELEEYSNTHSPDEDEEK